MHDMVKADLRQQWTGGATTIGAWCFSPDALIAELVSKIGYDYVGIDMQHGPTDFAHALNMIRAIDLGVSVPVVRLRWNDPAHIGQVLDAGAMGIIVPMINSAEDAAAAVRAARYAPEGERSYGPIRAEIRDGDQYLERANERIAVIPMIETVEALDSVEDIVAVPGVDAVYVGVYDLSLAMGLPAGPNDGIEEFDAALSRVLEACGQAGVIAGCHANPATASRRLEQGFRMVSASADIVAVTSGLASALEAARASIPRPD